MQLAGRIGGQVIDFEECYALKTQDRGGITGAEI
jgi:hypothetical protein